MVGVITAQKKTLTLLHKECTECLLGLVSLNNLSAAQPASHSLRHHDHLWATGSHLQGPRHMKAKETGRRAEHRNFQIIKKRNTNLCFELWPCTGL